MPYLVLTILVFSSIFASAGAILVKMGATGVTQAMGFLNFYVCVGVSLYALGALLFVYALSTQSLVMAYPFTILNLVFVYLSGVIFLGEVPTRSAAMGIVLILAGLYLIARNPA